LRKGWFGHGWHKDLQNSTNSVHYFWQSRRRGQRIFRHNSIARTSYYDCIAVAAAAQERPLLGAKATDANACHRVDMRFQKSNCLWANDTAIPQ
jgi:hypothetical protein